MKKVIESELMLAARRLLSEINLNEEDPYYGCLDRRYWAWKLVDMPESSYQRGASVLAWAYQYLENDPKQSQSYLEGAKAAFLHVGRLQHADGSVDQAYPNEHSFSVSAFMLGSLLTAYEILKPQFTPSELELANSILHGLATFVRTADETHGSISNHWAGAAYGLSKFADEFDDDRCMVRANEIISKLVKNQSAEGWLPEYGGADPGYQSLCLHYLSQIFIDHPSELLSDLLEKVLQFQKYFAHPNGSLGGYYGSRRTRINYPTAYALMPSGKELFYHFALGINENTTPLLSNMDIANIAPLAESYICVLPFLDQIGEGNFSQSENFFKSFKHSSLIVFSNSKYYGVLSARIGGTFELYSKSTNKAYHAPGYVLTSNNEQVVTQVGSENNKVLASNKEKIELEISFLKPTNHCPTPFQFLVLRILSLSLLKIDFLNSLFKKFLAKMLIHRQRKSPFRLKRTLELLEDRVKVTDKILNTNSRKIDTLKFTNKSQGIHMASAGYLSGFNNSDISIPKPSAEELRKKEILLNYEFDSF